MFIAAGVGAYQGAMFHLFTHAFFKALLFLAAGSVIVGMHHEQDMRKMGGLWNKLPITWVVMLIGTLAITGVGLPGIDLGFAGFYSKDAIINAAYLAGADHNPIVNFAFFSSLIAAGLTSFYSWRLIFMTFHGTPKWAHDAHAPAADHDHAHGHDDAHAHAHDAHGHDDHAHGDHGHGHDGAPHESPWVILLPILLLSVGAIFAGGVFAHDFIGEGRSAFWRGAIFTLPTDHVLDSEGKLPAWEVWAPLSLTVIGAVIAWYVYVLKESLGAAIAARKGPIWSFLYNKWYFDELYEFVFVRGAKALGDLFWKGGDQKLIDGLGPNGVAWVSAQLGKRIGRFQSGYVYHYAFVMLVGVAGLLGYAMMAWRR
jgi:NADH-quinone oxidoreductase subunit L